MRVFCAPVRGVRLWRSRAVVAFHASETFSWWTKPLNWPFTLGKDQWKTQCGAGKPRSHPLYPGADVCSRLFADLELVGSRRQMGNGRGRFDAALASYANQNTYVVVDRHNKQPNAHQHLGRGVRLAVVSLVVSGGEQLLYVVVGDHGLVVVVLLLVLVIWTGAGAASHLWPATAAAAAAEMVW